MHAIPGNTMYKAYQKRFLLFQLPPNTTHLLQPCDVGLFGPWKRQEALELQKRFEVSLMPLHQRDYASMMEQVAHGVAKKLLLQRNRNLSCGTDLGLSKSEVMLVTFSKIQ